MVSVGGAPEGQRQQCGSRCRRVIEICGVAGTSTALYRVKRGGGRLSRARTYNITVMSGTFQPIKLEAPTDLYMQFAHFGKSGRKEGAFALSASYSSQEWNEESEELDFQQ